jgi:hypothetical protein
MMLALLAGLAFGAPLDDLVPLAPDARAEVVFDRNVRAITPIAATHSDGSSWVQLITSRSDAVEVTWYDGDLQPADTTLVEIPARTSLRTWARDGDAMFLVFGGDGPRGLWLLEVPIRPGPVGAQPFTAPRPIRPEQVLVSGNDLFLCGRSTSRDLTFYTRLDDPDGLAKLDLPDLPRELAAGRLHRSGGGVDLLLTRRGGGQDSWLIHHEGGAAAVLHDFPRARGDIHLIDAQRLPQRASDLLVGTYGEPQSKGVAGIFAERRTEDGVQWRQTHPFLLMEDFYSFLPEARADRATRRATRRAARGQVGLPFRFVLHDVQTQADRTVIAAEAYAPEYRTENRTETQVLNGRVITRQVTVQVFVGWRAVLVWVGAIDVGGSLAWSKTLRARGLYPTLDTRAALSVRPERVALTVVDNARLAQLTVTLGAEAMVVERRITGEEVLAAWQTGAEPWEEDFLIWGMQRVAR